MKVPEEGGFVVQHPPQSCRILAPLLQSKLCYFGSRVWVDEGSSTVRVRLQ